MRGSLHDQLCPFLGDPFSLSTWPTEVVVLGKLPLFEVSRWQRNKLFD